MVSQSAARAMSNAGENLLDQDGFCWVVKGAFPLSPHTPLSPRYTVGEKIGSRIYKSRSSALFGAADSQQNRHSAAHFQQNLSEHFMHSQYREGRASPRGPARPRTALTDGTALSHLVHL